MHDLGEIGRGQRVRIGDGMEVAEHLVAWPWPWRSRSARTASVDRSPERRMQMCPNTKEAHPRGLYVVCIAELCERFAGCLLLSLLVLYLTERLALPPAQAIRWVGSLNAAGYVAAVGGGWFVGRTFTAFRGAVLGAVLLAAGFLALALEGEQSLLPAFSLLILGSGLYRPAIALLLDRLCGPRDPRRDAGHTWFWIAVNVGGVFAPLAAGSLKTVGDWQVAFMASALAMLSCVFVLIAGRRHLKRCSPDARHDPIHTEGREQHPKANLRVLGAAILAIILYAAAYAQVDGVLLLWAQDRTDRFIWGNEIPVAWFSSLPALWVLLLGPALLVLLKKMRSRGQMPSSIVKMTLGLMSIGAGYVAMALCASTKIGDIASPLWLLLCSAALVVGELLIAPIGLALMTRLFVDRYGGLGSGFWFALTAMGTWMGSELGAVGQGWPAVWFFAGMAGLVSTGGLLVGVVGRGGDSVAGGAWGQ